MKLRREEQQQRQILDVRAADLQEEMAEHRFPFRQFRRRRRQPSEHRRERSEQSHTARAAAKKPVASVGIALLPW
jgi:hypothetical protein